MRTLTTTIILLAILTLLASCGGEANNVEAKKAELEKLKAKQTEMNEQIAALQEEIAKSGDSSQFNAENAKAKVVAVTAIAPSTFVHSIDVQGRVESDQNISLAPRMSGTISKIYLKAGSHVSVGQVIAEIENEAVKAQVRDLKANLDLASQLYEKQKNLWEQKVGTEMQYLQAKTNKESLEAKLANAQEMLDMYSYKSPINGVVDNMPLKIGQLVSPGSPDAIVRVVNLSDLKVKADLSEAYAGNIKDGDKAELYFPDIDKSTGSSVAYSGKVINAVTRTFNVEIKLPNDPSYRPNMIVEIRVIDYKKDNTVVIPINTVQQMEGKNVVFLAVKEGSKTVAKKREVKVGKMYNGKVEILEGLAEHENLITTGYQDLNDGEVIKY